MKKTIQGLLIPITLIISSLFLYGGCDDAPGNVGYHFVLLQPRKFEDLIRSLDNKDEAIVYNSLCNLTMEVKTINEFTTQDKFKGLPQHDTALIIHEKAMHLISSDDPWVSSAAIRLLGELKFDKPAFLNRILQDNRRERNVQLEICEQLGKAEHKDQRLLRTKILFLRSQKDWLLQHSAYVITDEEDSCASDIFLDDYLHSSDPDTRRLALAAMNRHADRTSFKALAHAYDTTVDEDMKTSLFLGLLGCNDQSMIEDWAFSKPGRMDTVLEFIAEVTLQNNPGQKMNPDLSQIILRALGQGWRPPRISFDPDEAFFPGENYLYKHLLQCKYNTPEKPDSITTNKAGTAVERALLTDPNLRKEWLDYEARYKPRLLSASLIKKHRALMESFLKSSHNMILDDTKDTILARFFEKELLQQEEMFRKATMPIRSHG